MKTCPYCKESVKDDAVKCRYCHSKLVEDAKTAGDNRVTYNVDQDIIRFAKFAGAVLGVFGVVGLFLFGISTEETVQKFKEASDTLERNQIRLDSIQTILIDQQKDLERAKNDMATAQDQISTHQLLVS